MRWIPRLKVHFCDIDGYILGEKDAIENNLVVQPGSDPIGPVVTH